MSKSNGFLQLRRGVWEHLRDGRMSHMDALAFIYIVSQADTRTGVWNGSASSLAGEIVVSPRNARRLLERLTEAGYLKRFSVPGKHVCYPVLVHKYPISDGQHKGEHLDAASSTSATLLRYIKAESGEQEGEHKGEHKASQKILDTRDRRQKPAAKPTRPTDPRFGPFLELATATFKAKHGNPPTWDCFGKDGAALSAFLRRAPHVTTEAWQIHLSNYLDSTEQFTTKQGGSLTYFVNKFDAFASGPILEPVRGSNGKSGKPSIGDNVRTTLSSHRELERLN